MLLPFENSIENTRPRLILHMPAGLSVKGKGQGKRRADPLKEGYARLARMDHDDQKHGPLTDAEKAAAKIKPKKKAGQAKFQPKRNVRKGVRRR